MREVYFFHYVAYKFCKSVSWRSSWSCQKYLVDNIFNHIFYIIYIFHLTGTTKTGYSPYSLEYQPSGVGGSCSPPTTLYRLKYPIIQNVHQGATIWLWRSEKRSNLLLLDPRINFHKISFLIQIFFYKKLKNLKWLPGFQKGITPSF